MKLRRRFGQDIKLNDPARPENSQKTAYLPEENELAEWFADSQNGLKTRQTFLLSCDAALPPSQSLMPVFPVPVGETSTTLLEKNSEMGLKDDLESGEAYEERFVMKLV